MQKDMLIHRDLTRGRVSRREALAGLAALGFSTSAATYFLAKPLRAQEAKRGGRLKLGFAVGSPNDTLDPHRGSTAMDQCMCANLYSRLVAIASNLEPESALAVAWEPNAAADIFYWMAVGKDFREVATIDKVVRDKTPAELLNRTTNYWRLWDRRDRRTVADLPPLVIERYKQSLLIIRSQIDHSGAVIAANDTDITRFARDTYSYMWPRDGALVVSALMRAGHSSPAHNHSPTSKNTPKSSRCTCSHAPWNASARCGRCSTNQA